MNEALKKDKVRLKGQESDASASDAHISNCSQGSRVVCILLFLSLFVSTLLIVFGLSYVHSYLGYPKHFPYILKVLLWYGKA